MNNVTKGLVGLVLWLAAGIAFTELTAVALSVWLHSGSRAARPEAPTVAVTRTP